MELNTDMRSTVKSTDKNALGRGLSNIALRRTPMSVSPSGVLSSEWEINNDNTITEDRTL